MAEPPQPSKPRRKFILCFDGKRGTGCVYRYIRLRANLGTGNKFSGTDADSNILKIYRLLDRNEDDQFHYYQPGIGTYVVTTSRKDVAHSSRIDRLKSWYIKAKDSAIGTWSYSNREKVWAPCVGSREAMPKPNTPTFTLQLS